MPTSWRGTAFSPSSLAVNSCKASLPAGDRRRVPDVALSGAAVPAFFDESAPIDEADEHQREDDQEERDRIIVGHEGPFAR